MRLCCCCAGGHGSSQVLAQDSQSEGGDVPQRAGGDPGRDRAVRVREGDGAALPSAGQVCVQSALSGERSERNARLSDSEVGQGFSRFKIRSFSPANYIRVM